MIINCPCCALTFKQEPLFLAHLSETHNKTDHLQLYLDVYFDSVHPACACSSDCKEKLKWNGWNKGFQSKFVRGHNAKVSSTFKDPDKQAEFTQKRISNYANGATTWNKGLTKETSVQVKESSEKISRTLKQRYESGLVSWQSNKTKESSESLKKMSDTKKRKFSSGELSIWNVGLTKETHPSIDSASKKISAAYVKREMGRRITESSLIERLSKFSDKFELVSDVSLYKTRRVARLCFKCVKCKTEQLKSLAMLEESPVCFFCSPKESKGQQELFHFVKSISPDAILSDRTIIAPKELDVWVPSRKLGIEFNGLYWHSSKVISDELYHLKKELACAAANVSLLSIFEDEWRDKRQLVESMIKHRLGIDLIKINARDLKVCVLNSKESKEFFDKNHLDGHTPAQQTFALKNIASGVVFAALSLRRPFHKKYASRLEVARCACLLDHNVRGWLGKLTRVALAYALSINKGGLMTYVDGRIGKGQGYANVGWVKQVCSNQPRFWWTDFENKYNRFQYKANKNENKTEKQVALDANVVKIFGCSNSLYFYD